jgi:vacuolar-type H+-ATPase subunit I/STV1
MAMNLVGELAQYAVEVDQIIRTLAKERDDLKRVADAQQEEIKALNRRITDGKAENERLISQIKEYRQIPPVLESVRKPDSDRLAVLQAANAKESK